MNTIEYIRLKQREWFIKIKPFLLKTNLNVGSGLGHFSESAKKTDIAIVSLEVAVHPETINQKDLVLYDGKVIPFPDRAFESVIAMYVLHHSSDPHALLKQIKRVASRRIIFVEELYTNFIGKIFLTLFDFYINAKSRQRSKIHWNSYIKKSSFVRDIEKSGWKVTHYSSTSKFGFDEVLCVADKF